MNKTTVKEKYIIEYKSEIYHKRMQDIKTNVRKLIHYKKSFKI